MTRTTSLTSARGWKRSSQCLFSQGRFVRNSSSGRRIYQERDIVLLKSKGNDRAIPILTRPLRSGEKNSIVGRAKDTIAAEDIIGKAVRDLVTSSRGIVFRIHDPSLAEYTDGSPRLVTPIYSQDANFIVSLLDLHPSTPDASNGGGQDRIEIFEAGTGHGALTLNLARAVHGANSAAPPLPSPPRWKADDESPEEELEAKAAQEVYDTWRAGRRAVIHTLDQNASFSKHAEKTVRDFRHGMYRPNVDFHVGSINDFINGRLSVEGSPFLQHAILDLPNTHKYFDIVGQALKSNGTLVTWCPSITQINSCVALVRKEHMPFLLEKAIEVGQGITGGREWDVKMVRPKAAAKVSLESTSLSSGGEDSGSELEVEEDAATTKEHIVEDGALEMVCRPKVGVRTFGGGFIGVWRKMER